MGINFDGFKFGGRHEKNAVEIWKLEKFSVFA
jgi:hypothetical protein